MAVGFDFSYVVVGYGVVGDGVGYDGWCEVVRSNMVVDCVQNLSC